MSGQQGPPSRPWFRLATMIRPPPPPPAPAPAAPTPPPPRPAFIRPAFSPTITPPPPQANPTPSPPPPTPPPVQVVAPPTPPPPPSSPPPKPTQSSAPNTPPSQQSTPPSEILNSPPPSPPVTNTSPISTTPPPSPPEQVAPPLPPVNMVTPPAASPKIQKIPLSAQSPPPPQTPPRTTTPSQQSAPPGSSPPPSTTTTTRTLTPPKNVNPLEHIPTVNVVVTPPASPRIQKSPISDQQPSPPTKTNLGPSPPLPQSEHPLPVSDSPQPRSIPPISSPPRIIKLPEQTSPTVRSLSPLVLPSPKEKSYNEIHPKYKQKTMHVPETIEKPKDLGNSFNGMHIAGNTHSSKHEIPRKPETHKKHWDSSQVVGKSVITIAGDNKGAIMSLSPSGNIKHEFNNSKHNYPTSSSHEETLKTASEAKNKHQNSSPLLKTTFLNSNVQGVNNSILYNCDINHHDPGIHLTLSRMSDGDCGIHPKEHKKG